MRNALAGLRSLVERDPLGRVAFDPAWIAKEGGIPEGLTQWPRTVYALMALVAAGKVARVDGTGDWRLC